MNKTRLKASKTSGFSLLLAVIIISLVGLLIASVTSLSGIDLVKHTVHLDEGLKAKTATEGCLEEAMGAIRGNINYAGGSITIGNTTCTVTITNANPIYTIVVRLVYKNIYTREIETVFNVSGVPRITSFKEINE